MDTQENSISNAREKVLTYWPFSVFSRVHLKKDPGAIPEAFFMLGYDSVLVTGKISEDAKLRVRHLETGNVGRRSFKTYCRETVTTLRYLHRENAQLNIFFNWSNLNTVIAILFKFSKTLHLKKSVTGRLVLKMDSDGSYLVGRRSLGKFVYASLLVLNSFIFDKLIIESSCGKNIIRRYTVNPNKVAVVGNGISKKIYRLDYSAQKFPIVLSVGRISREKGTDLTIGAFARAQKNHKNWTLEIVGPIEDQEYFSELTSLVKEFKLDESVKFMGEIGDHELVEKLNKSWIFCSLSREEGFSIARLEALHFGLLTIITEAGCGKDLEKYGATVVKINDLDAAAIELSREMKKFQHLNDTIKNNMTIPSWEDVALEILIQSNMVRQVW